MTYNKKEKNTMMFITLGNPLHTVDYNSESTGCLGQCDDDYCRCSRIVNTKVIIDANTPMSLARQLCVDQREMHNTIPLYCLERYISCILRKNPDCMKVNVVQGYYGQETDGVDMTHKALCDINSFIKTLNASSKKDYDSLVEQVLIAEYGFLLPSLEKKSWNISSVPIEKISLPQEVYRGSDSKFVDDYAASSNNLSCLCRKTGPTYTLVDGYHRYAAAKNRKDKEILVVWCDAVS